MDTNIVGKIQLLSSTTSIDIEEAQIHPCLFSCISVSESVYDHAYQVELDHPFSGMGESHCWLFKRFPCVHRIVMCLLIHVLHQSYSALF